MDSLVQHTYYTGANDTTYTITLVATNGCGSDTANYTITVLPNNITAFFNTDTTSGCAPPHGPSPSTASAPPTGIGTSGTAM